MIFCLIFIAVAVLFIIGQFFTSAFRYSTDKHSKAEIEACKNPEMKKRMKKSNALHRASRITDAIFGEADLGDPRPWLSWIVAIIFIVVAVICHCSDASEVTLRNARYDSYKVQLEQGYVWETQDSIASEQRYVAGLKAYVEEHPIRTFYNAKDVNALYDKVMSFEIPAVEDTCKYKLATKPIVDERGK